ncbi:MAG: HlyD family efflux transporter periplasmic adaptor subunit [Bacteroidia bacterium]|jgi:multidrug resistance efflux pump|nr:HlyD family efflux transporter periplasmic adaptor subunit [Bacteroidia bacterium]
MTSLQKIFKWLFSEGRAFSQIYLLSGLQALMYLGITLGVQSIITYTMIGTVSTSLVLLCLLTLISVVFVGLFQLWQMRINETVYQRIFSQLTSKVTHYLAGLNETERTQVGPKINHFLEVVSLQKGIGKILLDLSFAIISIIFGLLILPAYSMWFLIFSIISTASFIFIIRIYGGRSVESSLKTSKHKYRILNWFQHSKEQNAGHINEMSNKMLDDYILQRSKHYSHLEAQYKSILVFKMFFVSLVLFAGVYLVQIGQLNIGQFVASEIIIILVINSVEKLVLNWDVFFDITTAITKLEELLPNYLSNELVELESAKHVYNHHYPRRIKLLLYSLFGIAGLALFAPWTQTVEAFGTVTTINPENRPQTITSRISGRVEKWYVNEGDQVKKNDTIAFLSEIKEEYIDPQLISRWQEQVKNKESAIRSYEQKINAINDQVDAINASLALKTEQTRNKVTQARVKLHSDSIDMVTNANNLKVAEDQFKRYEDLLIKGIISKTDLENRKVKLQESITKKIAAENKWINSKNDLINAEIELNNILQEFNEKLMKAESEKFSSLSTLYEAQATLTKMQNQLSNYSLRAQFYYVLSPQDGYITRSFSQGLGEIIKEGEPLCSIVPTTDDKTIELFIAPVDLPLVQIGQHVQIVFDGWPAFVFSGWPGVSFGTYDAEVVAIDRNISPNGKFRILARASGGKWPDAVQIGSGVSGNALLKDVPVFYELWRKANGFPPEYYQIEAPEKKK